MSERAEEERAQARARQAKWYAANKERARARAAAWKKANPEYVRASNAALGLRAALRVQLACAARNREQQKGEQALA